MKEVNKLLVLDGTNLLHRSYHALVNTDMRVDGEAVWAVHGLVNQLSKYISGHRPTSVAVAFDAPGGCPIRKELAPFYKDGRSETPAELRSQLALVSCLKTSWNGRAPSRE